MRVDLRSDAQSSRNGESGRVLSNSRGRRGEKTEISNPGEVQHRMWSGEGENMRALALKRNDI